MKLPLLILFYLLVTKDAFSQKTGIVIIQKISVAADIKDLSLISLCDSSGNELFESVDTYFHLIQSSKQNASIIIVPLKELPEYAYLGLLIDNKGGYVSLINECGYDTLRIAKWVILNNGIADTLKTVKTIYDVINDNVRLSSAKTMTYSKVKQNGNAKIYKSINVTINGVARNYLLKINTITKTSIMDGFDPPKTYRDFLANKNPKHQFKYHKYSSNLSTSIATYGGVINPVCDK